MDNPKGEKSKHDYLTAKAAEEAGPVLSLQQIQTCSAPPVAHCKCFSVNNLARGRT